MIEWNAAALAVAAKSARGFSSGRREYAGVTDRPAGAGDCPGGPNLFLGRGTACCLALHDHQATTSVQAASANTAPWATRLRPAAPTFDPSTKKREPR